MIALFDTWNNQLLSMHFSLRNAVKAQRKHLRAVQKWSKNSYLTYGFAEKTGNENDFFPRAGYPMRGWKRVDGDYITIARMELDSE